MCAYETRHRLCGQFAALSPQQLARIAKVTRFTFKTSTSLESRLHRPQPVTVPCNHLERATNQRRQFNGVMTSRARSNPGKARAHILLRIRLPSSGQLITNTLPVIGLVHTAEHLARGRWRRQRRSLCLMHRVARLGKARLWARIMSLPLPTIACLVKRSQLSQICHVAHATIMMP